MSKRAADEELNTSKRHKICNDMAPPSFIPKNPSTSNPQPKNVNIKLQTSIRDMKSHQYGYFSDDDDNDEDLWFAASQIEERELKATQKTSLDVTFSDFHDAVTSTQLTAVPIDAKLRVLQNKCSALEKQLKRNLPTIAKAQAQASQANCEVNDLKVKIKQLHTENEDLKKEKFNMTDKISTATATIRNENESLRKKVVILEKNVSESSHEINVKEHDQLDPEEVKNEIASQMTFHENRMCHLREIFQAAIAYKRLKFNAGTFGSSFYRRLISLQLKIAEMQTDFENDRSGRQHWEMFDEMKEIIFEISEDIKSSGLRHLDEHFVRLKFAFKQTQYCSDQYFGDRRNRRRLMAEPTDGKSELTKDQKLFEDEIRVDHRRLIAIISILIGHSNELAEMMLSENVGDGCSDQKTLIDIICDTIDPHIIQSRFLYKNSGITAALADLIKNLSIHYENYQENDLVNRKFEKFFSHILTMSTNNPKILFDLSEFLINILRHKNGTKLLTKFCKNFPSSNVEYSQMFKIYQIPRCGCVLQIFFILLASAFRFFENVQERDFDLLFDMTINLNTLVYLFMANGCDLEFLQPQSVESNDSKNCCKCYMFLVTTLIILNNQALAHRNNQSDKHFQKISIITKSSVVTLMALLSHAGKTIDFRSFLFGYNAINEIYTWIKHGDIYIADLDKFYNCKKTFLTMDCHEEMLEKLLINGSCDFSCSFITCESNPEPEEIDEGTKLAKQDLWNELSESFHADESDFMRASFIK